MIDASFPVGIAIVVAVLPRTTGEGWIGDWTPGIGDPSFGGWLTVLLYFFAAWRCRTTARALAHLSEPRGNRLERRCWLGLATVLAALGVNKQLDLQSALTELGRVVAREQGWYDYRSEVQRVFVASVAVVALLAMVAVASSMRRMPFATKVAAAGLCLLSAFVVIRAASFHHFDVFIGARWLGVRTNWVLEIGGIALILAAALWRVPRSAALRRELRPAAARRD